MPTLKLGSTPVLTEALGALTINGAPTITDLSNVSGTLVNSVQDNITRLGTVTTGTLGSGVTFPAGHVVAVKVAIFSADGSNYLDAGSSSTWVGTDSDLNITHAMNHADNMIIFTITTFQMYVSSGRELYVAVGLTSDLVGADANIIRYAGEGSGGDNAAGKSAVYGYITTSGGLDQATWNYKHLPATTSSRVYQPIMHSDGYTDAHLVTNNDRGAVFFSLTEVQLG